MQKISVGERPIGSDYLFVGDDGMRFDMTDSGGALLCVCVVLANRKLMTLKLGYTLDLG